MPSERFQFHYVKTKTGSISGSMVLRQTEDAINDLGDYAYSATLDATEALEMAQQAIDTANTASSNASNALTTANSALSQVQTLTVTVNSWDGRIKTAESNASNALTQANSAVSTANQAVETANAANSKSDQAISTAKSAVTTATEANSAATQAVGTANSALQTAQNAVNIANSAVTDTEAIREEVNDALNEVNEAVSSATTQAQNAAGSASAASGSAELAKKWATKVDNTAPEGEPADYTVDGTDFSAKWNAGLAEDWAVKMDGQVTDDGTPEGTPVDYSSKYYAQKAASSATAASGSATAAAGSATAASKSETNAARSATSAASSATAASGSATTAQNAATAAKTAQTAAEAARDEAVEVAGANRTAVLYSAQTLATAQQTQARKNVGAVGTSGNETVAGTKTFSNSISVSANPLIQSTNWSGVKISDTSHSASQNKMLAVVNDEDGKRFAGIEVTAGASGDRNIHISLRARDNSTWVTPWKVAELADGSIEESITGKVIADSFSGDLSGNADTATKLKTARTISLSGDVTGSASFNGSANAAIAATLANSGATAGTYGPTAAATLGFGGSVNVPKVVVDAKGRVTSIAHYAIKLPADPTGTCVKTSGNQTVGGTKTFSSRILSSLNPTSWVNAANGQTLINSTLVNGAFVPLWQYETTDGDSFVLAGFKTNLQIAVVTSENKATSTNTSTTVFSLTPDGNLSLVGSVTANAFNGNATSATKATQDANGNVIPSTYATKTECNNKIPKSGSAGTVSCYETVSTNTTINQSSPSSIQTSSAVSVSNGTANTCWVKVARLTASSPSVTLGSSWKWQGGSTPTLKQNCFVVCCWCGSGGIAIANNIS